MDPQDTPPEFKEENIVFEKTEETLLLGPKKKNQFWKFFLVFLAIVLMVGAVQVFLNVYPSYVAEKETEKMLAPFKKVEEAMKADTYGGKTPEETLQMFVDALEKGDMELASKYFYLETDWNNPNYLTQKEWLDALKGVVSEEWPKVIALLKKSKPYEEDVDSENYKFAVIKESEPGFELLVTMRLNTFSGIWKLTGM